MQVLQTKHSERSCVNLDIVPYNSRPDILLLLNCVVSCKLSKLLCYKQWFYVPTRSYATCSHEMVLKSSDC